MSLPPPPYRSCTARAECHKGSNNPQYAIYRCSMSTSFWGLQYVHTTAGFFQCCRSTALRCSSLLMVQFLRFRALSVFIVTRGHAQGLSSCWFKESGCFGCCIQSAAMAFLRPALTTELTASAGRRVQQLVDATVKRGRLRCLDQAALHCPRCEAAPDACLAQFNWPVDVCTQPSLAPLKPLPEASMALLMHLHIVCLPAAATWIMQPYACRLTAACLTQPAQVASAA